MCVLPGPGTHVFSGVGSRGTLCERATVHTYFLYIYIGKKAEAINRRRIKGIFCVAMMVLAGFFFSAEKDNVGGIGGVVFSTFTTEFWSFARFVHRRSSSGVVNPVPLPSESCRRWFLPKLVILVPVARACTQLERNDSSSTHSTAINATAARAVRRLEVPLFGAFC